MIVTRCGPASVERDRLKLLQELLRENHVTPQDARREELARRPTWKIKKKKRLEGVI